MRIGQFTDTFLPVVDGVGRVVSRYAEVMGEREEACYVITPTQKHITPASPTYKLLEFRSLPLPGMSQYRIGMPALDRSYRRSLKGTALDIAHAHDPFIAGREALKTARRQQIPLVGTFHSKYYDDFKQVLHSDVLAKAALRQVISFYEKCNEVWVVSASTAHVLQDYGYKGPIRIFENGSDLKEPDPEKIAKVNTYYKLTDDPVLLYVGQMNWKKNIRLILEACALLKQGGTAFQLILAGKGPSEVEIAALAQELGIREQTLFTGHITDQALLDGLYARAELFLFPSRYDNAPMVVREAACLVTPALLLAGSDAAEIIEDRVNGLLADDSAKSMAHQITWALENPEALLVLGRQARETIPRPWEEVVSGIIERYQVLIEEYQSHTSPRR